MSKGKAKPGSELGRALVALRWGCASEAERKAVGQALLDARKRKAKKGVGGP